MGGGVRRLGAGGRRCACRCGGAILLSLLWLGCLLLAGQSARAQPSSDERRADLRVACEGSSFARISVSLPEAPDDLAALEEAVGRSIHGHLHNAFHNGGSANWYLMATSSDMLHGSGLIAQGSVDPAPLVDFLRDRDVDYLCIYILHPLVPVTGEKPPGTRLDYQGSYGRFFTIYLSSTHPAECRSRSRSASDTTRRLSSRSPYLSACCSRSPSGWRHGPAAERFASRTSRRPGSATYALRAT